MRINLLANGDYRLVPREGEKCPEMKLRYYVQDPNDPCLLVLTLAECRHREYMSKCLPCGHNVNGGLYCHHFKRGIQPSECETCEKRSPVA